MLWLNGKIQDQNDVGIAPNDRGFLLADGLFETLLVTQGKIIQLQDHLDRLRAGMVVLGIKISYTDQELSAAMSALLDANLLTDASLRLTVTRGIGPRGLVPSPDAIPTILITGAPFKQITSAPVRLVVSEIRRNEYSPLSNVKALNYLDNILALRKANEASFDDAIMLNTKGNVVCTTRANIFVRSGDRLLTPALSEGALAGVTRKSVIEKARGKGLSVEETVITLQDLKDGTEVFLTNSLIGKCAALYQ